MNRGNLLRGSPFLSLFFTGWWGCWHSVCLAGGRYVFDALKADAMLMGGREANAVVVMVETTAGLVYSGKKRHPLVSVWVSVWVRLPRQVIAAKEPADRKDEHCVGERSKQEPGLVLRENLRFLMI